MQPPGDERGPSPKADESPLEDYGRRTGIDRFFFRRYVRNTYTGWLEFAETILAFLLGFGLAIPIVKATMVPEGELGFGGLIFLVPMTLLAALLAAPVLVVLRRILADALVLRTLASIGMAVTFAITTFGFSGNLPTSNAPQPAAATIVLDAKNLPEGTALEARDAAGRTPLALAVWEASRVFPPRQDRIAVARLLLERGANVNTRDNDGQTPLLYALDHPALLDLLIAHGASPDLAYPMMSGGEGCFTMWYWVSRRGSPARLAAIADRFPDLKVPADREGLPMAGPLYDVSESEQPEMLRYFLGRGFPPDASSARCTFGKTPLHNVVHWPEPQAREGIDVLLAAGADLEARANGATPLMLAGSRPGTVRYLIERGANINAVDATDGRSVLDKYEYWQYPESASLLRQAGGLTGAEIRAGRVMPPAGK